MDVPIKLHFQLGIDTEGFYTCLTSVRKGFSISDFIRDNMSFFEFKFVQERDRIIKNKDANEKEVDEKSWVELVEEKFNRLHSYLMYTDNGATEILPTMKVSDKLDVILCYTLSSNVEDLVRGMLPL